MHIIKKEFRFVSNLQFALFNETNSILTMVSNKSLGCEITNWAGSCCCLIQLELHENKVEAKGCSKAIILQEVVTDFLITRTRRKLKSNQARELQGSKRYFFNFSRTSRSLENTFFVFKSLNDNILLADKVRFFKTKGLSRRPQGRGLRHGIDTELTALPF